jgi:cytochrome c biogenesis protein CcmG, thiol:disulfide interchange protein DsbE
MKPTKAVSTGKKRSGVGREKGSSYLSPAGKPSLLPILLLVGGGLVLLLAVLIFFKPAEGQSEAVIPARVGSRLSSFELTDIQGNKVRLRDYQGQVVLVNAWATWCPPCRAEMPALNAYYQQHRAEGFVILAINAGDPAAAAAEFARDYNLSFPVLLDPQTRLLDALYIRSFPTSILIGRDGLVKDIHIGILTPALIEEKISPLLSN